MRRTTQPSPAPQSRWSNQPLVLEKPLNTKAQAPPDDCLHDRQDPQELFKQEFVALKNTLSHQEDASSKRTDQMMGMLKSMQDKLLEAVEMGQKQLLKNVEKIISGTCEVHESLEVLQETLTNMNAAPVLKEKEPEPRKNDEAKKKMKKKPAPAAPPPQAVTGLDWCESPDLI